MQFDWRDRNLTLTRILVSLFITLLVSILWKSKFPEEYSYVLWIVRLFKRSWRSKLLVDPPRVTSILLVKKPIISEAAIVADVSKFRCSSFGKMWLSWKKSNASSFCKINQWRRLKYVSHKVNRLITATMKNDSNKMLKSCYLWLLK